MSTAATGREQNAGPVVSIIIPFHNCWEMTEACLQSVRENTDVAHEIILIDDASDAAVAGKARALQSESVKLIRNEERRSYSANNNQGARVASGRYLCMLNNDTLVTPGWLDAMVSVLEREPDIGVLGNKHLFPSTKLLHHCGMAADDAGCPWHLHPHTNPDLPAVNYQRDVPMVTFACVMIPRAFYEEMGGLDETYRNGYEDCDFCLRAKQKNRRVTYTPASVIYHHGQATPGRKQTDSANAKLFLERWGRTLEKSFDKITRDDRKYNEYQARRPRIRRAPAAGVHFAVHFNLANAFTWATADLALALQDRGVSLSLQPSQGLAEGLSNEKFRRLKSLMRGNPRGTYHVKWSHFWAHHMRQSLYGEVNAEFFCSNYNYPKGEKQLDLWLKAVQANGFRKIPISGYNYDILMDAGLAAKDCAVVPLGYSPEIDKQYPEGRRGTESAGRPLNILVVTNCHDYYRYGTDILVQALGEAFGPNDPVVVHIKDYGMGNEQGSKVLENWIREQKQFPRVEWHTEFLSKEALIDLYARMDVQVAPFRGEGFAMKILDSMALGLPVMMPLFGGPAEYAAPGTFLPLEYDLKPVTRCADADLHYLGKGAYWCEVRKAHMVEQLRALLTRRDQLDAVGQSARRHVHERYSWPAVAARFMYVLENWKSQRDVQITARRRPDRYDLSVIMPTRNRPRELAMTLEAFTRQTYPASKFEILVVDDHGDEKAMADVMRPFAGGPLNLRIMRNEGAEGPGGTRNVAIPHAAGRIVVFVGDDIVPTPTFLETHMRAHERFPKLESAMLGLTLWHPDLPKTPFYEMLTGKEGGQQFNYKGMADGRTTTFDRFYTSNCSLKRDFLIEEENLFNTRLLMHEDKELAFRLFLKGLELRHITQAQAHHIHAMTPRGFVERQKQVGRSLVELTLCQSAYIPGEHAAFLRAMEMARNSEAVKAALVNGTPVDPERLLQELLATYEGILNLLAPLQTETGTHVGNMDAAVWKSWLTKGAAQVWFTINELAMRLGMAEEWCKYPDDVRWAKIWLASLCLPRATGQSALFLKWPFMTESFPGAGAAPPGIFYQIANLLLQYPITGPLYRSWSRTRAGQMLRSFILQHATRKPK
jgi:GT2 family glycosyltransferase/glycosyltransferase involved in cell wall biosynthesis